MDPYKILNIGPTATSREILVAVGKALRERKHSGHEIAQAQRELLDSNRRCVHDFLHQLDVQSLLPGRPRQIRIQIKQAPLVRLTVFDDQE